MYSGYFHHEIKKNLVNAEQMFIAMGYKKSENEVLVLDEPICSDQVGNVSRDCMIAYVECQIMKVLKTHMNDMNMNASWQEILCARETVSGRFFVLFNLVIHHRLCSSSEITQNLWDPNVF